MTAPAVLIPAWPRALTREMACAYCSTTADRLPEPAYREGRAPRWTREQLDAWINERCGLGAADPWAEAVGQ